MFIHGRQFARILVWERRARSSTGINPHLNSVDPLFWWHASRVLGWLSQCGKNGPRFTTRKPTHFAFIGNAFFWLCVHSRLRIFHLTCFFRGDQGTFRQGHKKEASVSVHLLLFSTGIFSVQFGPPRLVSMRWRTEPPVKLAGA